MVLDMGFSNGCVIENGEGQSIPRPEECCPKCMELKELDFFGSSHLFSGQGEKSRKDSLLLGTWKYGCLKSYRLEIVYCIRGNCPFMQ